MSRVPAEPRSREASSPWGWTAPLVLVMAAGLLWVAFAFSAARREEAWAPLAFWFGLLVIVVPASARLLAPRVHRTERQSLVIALGLALYWVYVLRSPIAFTSYDELLHLRTFLDILNSGHLFSENPLLFVSPFYPGMESAAAAITQVSGLDPWASAVLLIGVMRLTLVLAAFLFFESVSGSAWVAGAASLIYMANQNFLFFDSSFAYESFALPLAIAVLWMLLRRQSSDPRTSFGLTAIALLCLIAVVISHPVTAVALFTALTVWSAVLAFARWRGLTTRRQGVGGMAAIGMVAALTWVLYVATETLHYLGPQMLVTFEGALRFIAGEVPGRTLFGAVAGGGAPAWERIVTITATLTIVAALPAGLALLWRHYRRRPAALLLGVAALAYPVALLIRLTPAGLEVASRANSFVFIGVAFVVALVLARLVRRLTPSRALVASPAAVGLLIVIFAGGVTLGSSWWERLPGPFVVGGESRAISPQGTAAAAWMLSELGRGNRIAADRSNGLLLGSVGDQRVVFDGRDPIELWPLYEAPTIDSVATDTVRQGDIRYVLVDRRLSTALPMNGRYFDQAELEAGHQAPIPAESLAKFDGDNRVNRIYDSGVIQIYDTSRLAHGP